MAVDKEYLSERILVSLTELNHGESYRFLIDLKERLDIDLDNKNIEIKVICSGGKSLTAVVQNQKITMTEFGGMEIEISELPPNSIGMSEIYQLMKGFFFNVENLLENKCPFLEIASKILFTRNNETIAIDKDTKLTKTLKKFSKWYGAKFEKDADNYILEYSKIMNQKLNDEITLVYSIHPLDYLTMSDNNNGWSSCLSAMTRGCYSTGILEMLNSSSTIVCYIESDSQTMYQGFWNSKTWRELIIIAPEILVALTGYPNHNPALNGQSIAALRPIVNERTSIKYDEQSYRRYGGVFGTVPKGKTLKPYIELDCNFMYKDFCQKSNQTSFAFVNEGIFADYKDGDTININFAGTVSCLECGKLWDEDEYGDETFLPDSIFCRSCMKKSEGNEDCVECHNCGRDLAYGGEQYTGLDNEIYCENCINDLESFCEECNNSYYTEDSRVYYNIVQYRTTMTVDSGTNESRCVPNVPLICLEIFYQCSYCHNEAIRDGRIVRIDGLTLGCDGEIYITSESLDFEKFKRLDFETGEERPIRDLDDLRHIPREQSNSWDWSNVLYYNQPFFVYRP